MKGDAELGSIVGCACVDAAAGDDKVVDPRSECE